MQRIVWNEIVSWQTRRLNNSTKYLLHASMITTLKKKWNLLDNCHMYALYWIFKCLHLARIARSITKWTKACDKRLNRLISNIHHTSEYRQYCHLGNTAEQCRLGLFQNSDFAGDLEDSKSTSGGTLCIFGSHTFVPISWMCKKQTSVSHSSTESEINLSGHWTEIGWVTCSGTMGSNCSVLGNVSRVSDRSGQPVNGKNKFYNQIDVVHDIDAVPSNVQSARQEALLYVFEDNEAVIKMIIVGRSPTMRHVSRTHRVALDWLFDRINQDSKSQIKYIDTKNQLEDILTKGNFTRDEWNHSLNLFFNSYFSSTACTASMAKRAQQGSGEGHITAKSRPMMNLTARTPSFVSSSTSSNPVRTSYGYQDLGRSVASDDRSGKIEKPSPPGYSEEDYGQSWSSQVWKSGAADHDRSGKPEKPSWDILQKKLHLNLKNFSRPKCAFRKVRRHDSRWIGETWDSESPSRGKFRKFRHGHWRSRICGQSQRPSAKQTEKNVERRRVRWRAFNHMGNVHGCDIECGDIHVKEFLNYSKRRQESWKSHLETDVRCHSAIGEQ